MKLPRRKKAGIARAPWATGINTQADTLPELRSLVRDAVACYFDDPAQVPKVIRLHFVRDEVLVS